MHFLPWDKWIRNHVCFLFPKWTALWDFNIWFAWFCPPKKQAIALALERNSTVCHVDLSGVKGAEVWRGLGLMVVNIDAGFWDVFPRFEFSWLVFLMFVASWKPCEDVYSTHFATPNKSWDQLWHKKSQLTDHLIQMIYARLLNISVTDAIYQQFLSLPIKRPQKIQLLVGSCYVAFSRWSPALSHTTWRWVMWILAMCRWVSKELRHPGRLDFQCQKRGVGIFWSRFLGKKTGSLNLNMFFFVILVMTDTQHAHGSKKCLKQILNSFFVGSDFFQQG